MSESVSKKNLVKWALAFVISLAFCLIPTGEIFTPLCQRFVVVTVFSILLLAFDLLDSLLIGLLLPFLWVITGCATFEQAMSGWASSYPLMFISAFILAKLLERIGLLQRIGFTVIAVCGGSFNKAIWGLFIASHIVVIVTFGMGQALPCVLGLAIMSALNVKADSPAAQPITLAVVLGGIQCLAYIYSPVSVTMITGAAQSVYPDFQLTWLQLAGHNMPVLLFGIVFLWGYLKWFGKKYADDVVFQSDSIGNSFKEKLDTMGKMSVAEKKALVIVILMLGYMLIAPVLNLNIAYGFFGAVMACYVPFINIGTKSDIKQGLQMSTIVFLVLAFISIGSVGMSCGFAQVIAKGLVPIMAGLGPIKSIYATIFVGTAANLVLTPGAMLMLLPGPVVQFCTDLGYNYLPYIYSIYLTEHAIFHPYEWPSYLTIFAFGLISMNRYVKLCCVKTVCFLLFIGIVMVPWWMFIVS